MNTSQQLHACEKEILIFPFVRTTSVCHNKDLSRVYLGNSNGDIEVHNLKNGKPLYSFKRRDESWGVPIELVLSNEENTLFAFYSNQVIVKWFNRAEAKLALAFQKPDIIPGSLDDFKEIVKDNLK